MLRKLDFRTMAGMAAALVLAGLPAAASAQRLPAPRPECMQQVQDYCAANWRTDPQMHFATQQACVDAYTEQCYYDWSYFI